MKPRNTRCSFCRKSHTDVGPLVEGPGDVYICGECTELCQSIIEQERRRRNPSPQPNSPALIREKLDQLVNGQDEAKRALMQAVGARQDGRGHVVLIGPSRSAKVLLARALAYALEVPFVAGDSNGLMKSKHGSKEVLPLLLALLHAGDFHVEAVQQGVIYVDGAERQDARDVLMHLWRENVCYPVEGLQVTVRGIVFVCGATFAGLDEASARLGRHPEQPMTVEVLQAVGVRADWTGYLAGVARVPPLDEETLARIVHGVDFRRVGSGPAEQGKALERRGF
ncbi:MAG TPA: ClpX C4-type zinc finger protein [Gemmataceae bacterium]|jgi:ATP-dependent Clp protease ATP-binding subunit ClpX|nr:ClpX C4-type zinc finger protein [Gemmataceae bacterium]